MTDKDFQEMARLMGWQLRQSRLSVELSESYLTQENGRFIRVATEQNPGWYRRFCKAHSPTRRQKSRQRRKHDTYIKRAHTIRALDELAAGKCETVYAQRLRPVVAKEFRRLVTAVEQGQSYF